MATKQEEKSNAPKTALATLGQTMPDFLRDKLGDKPRGSENVHAEDLIVPRLEVVQSLSPCRKENDPAYIPGAKEGQLYNNITRELYGAEVIVIPVFFRKEWLLWKNRDMGGGFRGAFSSPEAAEAARQALPDGADCDAIDTAQQFCLLLRPDRSGVEEIAVSMSRSKMKVSRRWNSLIRLAGGDSFSRAYRLRAVTEKNAKNQDYWNLAVEPAGWPTPELYALAEKLYEQVARGSVSVSRATDDGDAPSGGTEY